MIIGEPGLHPGTRAMLAAARALARNEAMPPAVKAEPQAADRLFAIERTPAGEARVRAFADGLVGLFGWDLRNADFAALFPGPDRALLLALLDAAAAAYEPGLAHVLAETPSGLRLGIELMFAPLEGARAGLGRHVVHAQPLGGETLLGGERLKLLRLVALRPPLARAPKTLRLVVNND